MTHGDGAGYGYGACYGYGDGYGDGYGSGDGELFQEYVSKIKNNVAKWILSLENTELRRIGIETIGIDKFFAEIKGKIIQEDCDGYNNPRQLIRIPLEDTERGYIQAVHVICPSTGRHYYLGVSPDVDNCQDAVASTFGIKGRDYHPRRES